VKAIINFTINSGTVEEHAKTVFQKHFDFDVSKRLRIIRESIKYRVKEDEMLSKEVKERRESYEVYFDNVFVCFFSEKENPPIVEMRFLKEIIKLKKEKKVFWNPHMYAVVEAEEEAKIKKEKEERKDRFRARMKKATSGSEKIVHTSIQKALKHG
jgi:hypothetical protein